MRTETRNISDNKEKLENALLPGWQEIRKYALILAGGSGSRMGNKIPKQFVCLAGKPVLMHTLEVFFKFDHNIEIILVLPVKYIDYWKKLCDEYNFRIPHQTVMGGPERFYSVRNGLEKIETEGIVFIHDGVRPLVSQTTLHNCYHLSCLKGNALPVISVSESVRFVGEDGNKPIDRNRVKLVQTPQTFKVSLIKEAYQQPFREDYTDDASVLGNAGYSIYLAEGNPENIKITWPTDIRWAEALFSV